MVRPRVRPAKPSVLHRGIFVRDFPGIVRAIVLVAGVGLLWTVAACGKNSPTSPSPPENSHVVNGLRTVTGLHIRGCAEGEGYQCRASLTFSDGDQENVSALTKWESDNWQIARVDAAGRVTPKFVGSVTLKGILQDGTRQGVEGTQKIEVMLPPVEIRGTVREPSGRDVVGAQVKVLDGPWAGTITTTDAHGAWTLSVPPTPSLKVFVSHLDYHWNSFNLILSYGDISSPRHLELLPWRSYPPPSPR